MDHRAPATAVRSPAADRLARRRRVRLRRSAGQRRAWVLVSRSGRRHVVDGRRLAVHALAVLVSVALVLLALAFYSPRLFLLPQGPGATALLGVRKLLADNLAAPVNVLFHREVADSAVPTVRLWIRPDAFHSLNRSITTFHFGDLPRKPRVEAWSELPTGELRKVKVSYRGANPWHHQAWKPSLRIRYRKDEIWQGHRDHVLVAPEDPTALRNWLSIELARRLELLHYDESFVRLFINGRYFGIYSRTWRYDESLLIGTDRLPGPFLRLENNSGPLFRRHHASWNEPATWEVRGGTEEEGRRTVGNLVAAIERPPGVERQELLNQLLDRSRLADWLTVLCYSGEYQVGLENHNLGFWLDPGSGLLVPLLTDVTGYRSLGVGERPVTQALSPIVGAWLADPRNLSLYVDRLHRRLHRDLPAGTVRKIVRRAWAQIRADALADVRTSQIGGAVGTSERALFPLTRLDAEVDAIESFIDRRLRWIDDSLATVRLRVVGRTEDAFEVLVEGLAGVVARRRVSGSDEPESRILLPTLGTSPVFGDGRFEGAYAFHNLSGTADEHEFFHRLTGAAVTPEREELPVAVRRRYRSGQGLHPGAFPDPEPTVVVVGPGEVRWQDDRTFGAAEHVVLEAGTTLLLGPRASVLIRGRLTVRGIAEAPVIVRDLDPERPFGSVAVVGRATAGSVIRHLRVEGGSTHRHLNLVLTGPFSVHDSPGIVIENSTFRSNSGGDDLFHAVRSVVEVRESVFEDALFDAVDFDQVRGTLDDCVFRRAGNDGLDLSSGAVEIRRSRFEDAGDKLISIGEGARVTVRDADLRRGPYGVAVKDDSRVTAVGCSFEACGVAWGSYRKKWRWERGGRSVVREGTFRASERTDLYADRHSRIVVVDRSGRERVVEVTRKTGEPDPP